MNIVLSSVELRLREVCWMVVSMVLLVLVWVVGIFERLMWKKLLMMNVWLKLIIRVVGVRLRMFGCG